MTVYVCEYCGNWFNSSALDKCPFCGAKVRHESVKTSLIKKEA